MDSFQNRHHRAVVLSTGPTYQILTLPFTIVANLQLQSNNENNFTVEGGCHHDIRNCIKRLRTIAIETEGGSQRQTSFRDQPLPPVTWPWY